MYYFYNEKNKDNIEEPEHLARMVLISHQTKLAPSAYTGSFVRRSLKFRGTPLSQAQPPRQARPQPDNSDGHKASSQGGFTLCLFEASPQWSVYLEPR